MVNVTTGERVPAAVWEQQHGEPFTVMIASTWEGRMSRERRRDCLEITWQQRQPALDGWAV